LTIRHDLIFGLDQKPPWGRTLVYGAQWLIIFLPILMIFSAVSAEYLGMDEAGRILLFQRILLTTGGIMIVQTLWGHGYPLLDGPSSALLLTLLVLAPGGLPAIQGGLIVGGILVALMGALRIVRRLEVLFTDNVIGVTIILIALTLLPYLTPLIIGKQPGKPQGDLGTFGTSLFTILVIVLFSQRLPGFLKTVSLLLGIGAGTLLTAILGRLTIQAGPEVPWFALPRPLFPGWPSFPLSAILPFLVAYLTVVINGVGSIYSIAEIVGKENLERRVDRGIGWTGVGGLAGGILGCVGTVSFGISPGVVLVTRVGSRFPVTLCGGLLCLLAFFQQLLVFLMSIPSSVVGAALLTAMASQVGAGISVLTRKGQALEGRDYVVIGLPILLAGVITSLPEAFFREFPPGAQAFFKNGLVIGIVGVLLLEHLVLRRKNSAG
jgi:xanthine/uracil permease